MQHIKLVSWVRSVSKSEISCLELLGSDDSEKEKKKKKETSERIQTRQQLIFVLSRDHELFGSESSGGFNDD